MDPIIARREARAEWDDARSTRVRMRLVGALGALLLGVLLFGGAELIGGESPALATGVAAPPVAVAQAQMQTPAQASSAERSVGAVRADAAGSSSKEQSADTRADVSGGANGGQRLGVLLMVVVFSVIAVASAVSGIVLQRRPRPGPRRGL